MPDRKVDVALALLASAGLHAILLLLLDAPGVAWRIGLQPALHVSFRTMPEVAVTAPGPPARRGTPAPKASDGASIPAPAPRYFTSREVDTPATPVNQVPLVIPEHAYVSKLAGVVRARVFIGVTGDVERVEILEARPHAGIFEEAALEALQAMKYRPAELQGRRVRSQKVVEVEFNPQPEGR